MGQFNVLVKGWVNDQANVKGIAECRRKSLLEQLEGRVGFQGPTHEQDDKSQPPNLIQIELASLCGGFEASV